MILLERGQHAAPTWGRFAYSQPEKRERHFCKHILRDQESGLCEHEASNFRHNMAP